MSEEKCGECEATGSMSIKSVNLVLDVIIQPDEDRKKKWLREYKLKHKDKLKEYFRRRDQLDGGKRRRDQYYKHKFKRLEEKKIKQVYAADS